jgi:uncharacterized protein YjiS (DUF1127 family)
MRTIRIDRRSVSTQRLLAVLTDAVAFPMAAVTWLDDKLDKRRSRRMLQELTDDQLKDIGISRADAFQEARRPFWD